MVRDNLWLSSNKNLFNIDSLVQGGLTLAQVVADKGRGGVQSKMQVQYKNLKQGISL